MKVISLIKQSLYLKNFLFTENFIMMLLLNSCIGHHLKYSWHLMHFEILDVTLIYVPVCNYYAPHFSINECFFFFNFRWELTCVSVFHFFHQNCRSVLLNAGLFFASSIERTRHGQLYVRTQGLLWCSWWRYLKGVDHIYCLWSR